MSSSKKLTCKGNLRQCVKSSYSFVFFFDPALWIFAPLTFSLVHLSPPRCVKVQYIQTLCGWEGVGLLVASCVGDHILQEFNTLYLTRFRTYKIALGHPKQKPKRGGGLRKTPATKSLYMTTFWIARNPCGQCWGFISSFDLRIPNFYYEKNCKMLGSRTGSALKLTRIQILEEMDKKSY